MPSSPGEAYPICMFSLDLSLAAEIEVIPSDRNHDLPSTKRDLFDS